MKYNDFLQKQEIDKLKNHIAILHGYIVIRLSNNDYNCMSDKLNKIFNMSTKAQLYIDDPIKYNKI